MSEPRRVSAALNPSLITPIFKETASTYEKVTPLSIAPTRQRVRLRTNSVICVTVSRWPAPSAGFVARIHGETSLAVTNDNDHCSAAGPTKFSTMLPTKLREPDVAPPNAMVANVVAETRA